MSAQYPTFTYGLSVISALSLTSRVSSPLPMLLSVLGLTMPIHAYLESRTISTDYNEFKIALPTLPNQPCRCVVLATCLPSLAAYTSASHFKLAGLVYRSIVSLLLNGTFALFTCNKPLLPICHLSCTLTLQHDNLDLLPQLSC